MINIVICLVQGVTVTSHGNEYLTSIVSKLNNQMTDVERRNLISKPNYSIEIGMLGLIISEFKIDNSTSECRLFFAKYGLFDPDVIAGFILKKYLSTLKKQEFNFSQEIQLAKKIQESREVPPQPHDH